MHDNIQYGKSLTQVAGKRSVVLSNEARKEMAKQARALKDERRALLDSRHKYLIAKIANGISLGEVEVEEALISDDKVGQTWCTSVILRHMFHLHEIYHFKQV